MQAARQGGKNLLEDDQVHLSYDGYRVMTRAVLDGLGYKDVPVPAELKVKPMPGIIREWRLRAAPEKESPLTEKSVLDLKPDGAWKTYQLPETERAAHWWMDQERQRGFAVATDKLVGAAKGYQGVAYREEKGAAAGLFQHGRAGAGHLAERQADLLSQRRLDRLARRQGPGAGPVAGRPQHHRHRNRQGLLEHYRRQPLVKSTRQEP